MIDPLRTYELQSAASGLSLCCDAPGAQSAGSIAHGSMPGARRATVLFLDTGFGVTAGKSENSATSAATGAFGMGKPPARVGALHGAHWGRRQTSQSPLWQLERSRCRAVEEEAAQKPRRA